MSRLEQVVPASMGREQRELFESIVGGKRARYGLDDRERIEREGLGGPFNVWMYAPLLGMHAQRLGEGLRFEGSLSDRQREIAILCVAEHWKADYEWWAHAKIAARHGVEAAVIAAILVGEPPPLPDDAERQVYELTRTLLASHRVPETLYRRTAQALGEPALVELVLLIGYYAMISMTLNVFEADLPPGEISPFAR